MSRDARGELVTLQTRLLGKLTPDQREATRRQCAALLANHGAAWAAPVRGWAEHRFRNGAIHAIRASAADFLKNAAGLFAVEPTREVTLTAVDDAALAAVAQLPEVMRIQRLVLRGQYTDAGVKALLAAQLVSLSSLALDGAGEGTAALLAKGKLTSLRVLCLTDNGVGDEGAAHLAKSTSLAGLEKLYLTRNDVGDEGAAALAKGKLTALQVLTLGGNDEITDEGAVALAKGKLAALVHLELNQTAMGDEGAVAIAESKKLPALKRLVVVQTEIGGEGRAALAKRKGLRVKY